MTRGGAEVSALIPPPRFHTARYHGVFAPCARARPRVVLGRSVRPGEPAPARAHKSHPGPPEVPACEALAPMLGARSTRGEAPVCESALSASRSVRSDGSPPAGRKRGIPWAELLQRVFAIDVLACPRCGARTRVISASLPPEATPAILESLGLPTRAPPPVPPRRDELWADDAHETGHRS